MKIPSTSDRRHSLVFGGAASGKSLFAEQLACQSPQTDVCYIATSCCRNNDNEWKKKVACHRHRRPASWRTIEEPRQLTDTLQQYGNDQHRILLIDCLTLWLCNLMDTDMDIQQHIQRLFSAYAQ